MAVAVISLVDPDELIDPDETNPEDCDAVRDAVDELTDGRVHVEPDLTLQLAEAF